ncbi:MAG: universal stress protein [Nitrospirae bacterium]|nr:universal stress protein [Nitrospirota bacterium]MBF0536324.1 universal stress protein [Nitrospirota bacterium]MBF0618265.1 universal stress protein [Nitrospirota bacterium]
MRDYRRVMVVINGSMDVLKHGAKMAKEDNCRVTALKVLPEYEGDLSLVGVSNIEDTLNSGKERIEREIRDFANSEKVSIRTRIEYGDITEKIIEAVEDEETDLVIMGVKKQGILEKILGDRTLDKVFSLVPCPLMVVRV